MSGGSAVLEARSINAGYGSTSVISEVSFAVAPASVTALLGPNGAGKTTTLRTLAGTIGTSAGQVLLDGRPVTGQAAHRRSKAGLCMIPEGRGIFRSLTVVENLRLQLRGRTASFDAALEVFPALKTRLGDVSGNLSGGQQQMLALARAYVSSPSIVLVDELSLGLAPLVIDEIFASLVRLTAAGVALLVVEQYVQRALDIADQVVLLDRGRVAFCGSPEQLDGDELVRSYLGVSQQ